MKLCLAITLLFAGAVVADPTQCFSCRDASDASLCTRFQNNQTCATDYFSLGTTHCGSVAVKYRGFGDRIETGFYQGCFNCTDKRTACFTLAGYLKDSRGYTLLECEIECCTGDNCNTQVPTLSQAAISVFSQNGSGLTQCQSCLEDDSVECILDQESQICAQDREALGTTHCGSAKITYRDRSRVEDGVIRGCIDCADKKAACALIGGYVKSRRGWSLTECDIECCTGNNCNDKAAGLPKCYQCEEHDAATCLARRRTELCTIDARSLGTTHCASAVSIYTDKSGNIVDGVFQGCINCTDKKATCDGAIKSRFNAKSVLACNLDCCTGENCNAGGFGITQCSHCVASDASSCSAVQTLQTCLLDHRSLGRTHCGSVVGKYLNRTGKELDVFYRGCIDCSDKKAACFAIGGALKAREWTLLKCEIECCNGGQCKDPTLTQDAITVFTPKASGPTKCNSCLENNATSCSDKQQTQLCSDPRSLGATHCGSAVGKYRDLTGKVVDGFVQGCINCADKKAACALLGGFLKNFRGLTQLECEIECCTGDNCNNQFPTLSRGGSPTSFSPAPTSPTPVVRSGSPASRSPASRTPAPKTPTTNTAAAGLVGCHILLSGLLAFASTFVNIMIFNHI